MSFAAQTSTALADTPNGIKSPESVSSFDTLVPEENQTDAGAKRAKKRQTKNKKPKGNTKQKQAKSTEDDSAPVEDDTVASFEIVAKPSLEERFTRDLQGLLEPLELSSSEDAEVIDPVTEFLSKRIRNLQKRKMRIDKIAEIPDTQKLNADQQAALSNRDYVEGLLKELTETLQLHKAQQDQAKAKAQTSKTALEEGIKAALVEAKDLGVAYGEDKIYTLIKFLRAASIKRQLAAQDFSVTPQSAGFEALLQLVYNGNEASLASVTSLYDGSLKLVAEDTVSYKTIRDVSRLPEEVLLNGGDLVTLGDEATHGEAGHEGTSASKESGETECTTDSGDASTQAVKISFLQESELDEDAAAAAPSSASTNTTTVNSVTEVDSANQLDTATAMPSDPVNTPVPSSTSAPDSATPTPEKPPQRKKRNYYNRRNNNGNGGSNNNKSKN